MKNISYYRIFLNQILKNIKMKKKERFQQMTLFLSKFFENNEKVFLFNTFIMFVLLKINRSLEINFISIMCISLILSALLASLKLDFLVIKIKNSWLFNFFLFIYIYIIDKIYICMFMLFSNESEDRYRNQVLILVASLSFFFSFYLLNFPFFRSFMIFFIYYLQLFHLLDKKFLQESLKEDFPLEEGCELNFTNIQKKNGYK